ncbi:RT0821/Lpp0805 family surface protein [Cupriavidus basilensis]|uniref:RT0821/Lpp0805 family surface protein n=1 Tax=Cupriavidus basilensis TaxID=68895 RepID=A0ABT6AX59_9BURK|nr:RT0821/Lpp0805 family surface protein [Cupriavidus basilensis]MDF3837218.1 RT0821/Lpp0805 family surface protein [Cupriavidus basilensis]
MTPRFKLRHALACTVLLGSATSALAYFDHFLSGTIIGTMSQKEAASYAQTVKKAITATPEGETLQWTFAAAGRRQQIDATVTPVRSKTDQGQSCRQLKTELKRGSDQENWSGWFCKQSDGQWKSRKVADD